MKILLIHSYYQQSGGEEVVFHQEQIYLEKTEEVRTLTFQNRPGWRGAIQFLLSVWNVFGAVKVRRMIREFQPDVIHIHNWHYGIGPILIRTAKKAGIPVVLTMHNYRLICPSALLLSKGKIFTDSMQDSFPWKAIRKGVYRNSVFQTFWMSFVVWVHKKAGTWKKADKYIILADFEKGLFLNSTLGVPESKMVVKPNFAHRPEIEYEERQDHFLFIGRLSEEKGIRVLLEAFRQTDFELRIGGTGPLKDLVLKACRENKNIKYLGYLSQLEVKKAMQRCTALVFPSICFEGLPMTMIEAFALGKVILAGNLGAMSIVLKHGFNGLHYENGNVSDLRAQLAYWQNLGESEKETYRKNVLSVYNAHYKPEQAMHQLMNVYTGMVEKKNNNRTESGAGI